MQAIPQSCGINIVNTNIFQKGSNLVRSLKGGEGGEDLVKRRGWDGSIQPHEIILGHDHKSIPT